MAIDLSNFTPVQPVGLVMANPGDLPLAENPQPFDPSTFVPAQGVGLVTTNPGDLQFAEVQTLTWIGGGDDSVYDADDWGPNSVPAAGDTLYMTDGTANMAGGNLAGDSLTVGYDASGTNPETSVNPTINLSGGADLALYVAAPHDVSDTTTVNVADNDTLTLGGGVVNLPGFFPQGEGALNIDIANGATLTDKGGTAYTLVTINGPGDYDPTTASFGEGSLKIQSDMIGTGNVFMGLLQGEIGGSVAAGVTVTLQVADTLTIDNPSTFAGTIVTPNNSQGPNDAGLPSVQVNLQGLVADSYDLTNDMLTLYKGSTVIDTLKFNDASNSTFVGQGASGVVIGINETVPSGVTTLPLHNGVTIGM